MHDLRHAYLNSLHILWQKQRNPVWIWIAILSCNEHADPFPNWVAGALSIWAERLLTLSPDIGDCGRALPKVFGLEANSAANHPLKIFEHLSAIESIAMEFAFRIFRGRKPSDARSDVAIAFPTWSDVRIRAALREHFEIERAPNSNAEWRVVIVDWLFNTPLYEERYPTLPRWKDVVLEKVGYLARSPS